MSSSSASRALLRLGCFTVAIGIASACTLEFDRSRIGAGADETREVEVGGDAGAIEAVDCKASGEGAPCERGTCRAGACCSGCWDGTQCFPGDQPVACGEQGGACARCAAPAPACSAGACVSERAIVSLSAAAGTSCGVDAKGALWCWGANNSSQFGRASPPESAKPVQAPATKPWREVAVGGDFKGHVCAIADDGSLWCWGLNTDAQLGVGHQDPVPEPSLVSDAGAAPDRWSGVAAGSTFTCGVRAAGTLWCWGWKIAIGKETAQSFFTVPTRVGMDAGWRSVSAGARHACAVKDDTSLWCWGDGTDGRLGREGDAATPGLVGTSYAQVACGGDHTCAVRTDGSLWCWGRNTSGQLGIGTASDAESAPRRVGEDRAWKAVTAGGSHGCALDTTGALFCWGANGSLQLGLGASTTARRAPERVVGDREWTRVEAGNAHTCAVDRAGALYCWGAGDRSQNGQSGFGAVGEPSPVPLPE